MPPEPSVTSACEGPRLCTLRYSSALLPKSFERPGPKSVSPATYCSGVEVVVWWRWMVDMGGSLFHAYRFGQPNGSSEVDGHRRSASASCPARGPTRCGAPHGAGLVRARQPRRAPRVERVAAVSQVQTSATPAQVVQARMRVPEDREGTLL